MIAVALFSGLDASGKWLVTHGYPVGQVVFVRYLVALVIMLAVFLPRQGAGLFKSAAPGIELLRAGALLGSATLNFAALRHLPLTVTGSITFLAPLLVAALSVPLLGETVGWRRWAAIVVGFFGVLIVIRPGTAAFHPAVWLALGMVVCLSFYNVLTRKLAGVDSAATQQIILGGVGTLVSLPFALMDWVTPTDVTGVLVFLAIGGFGAVGHLIYTVAYRFAPASLLGPFGYMQIVFFIGLSWLLFDQPPDGWFYAGATVVIASGIYLLHRETLARERTGGA